MSYLALARKWRPRRFEDVMGQGHVVKALTHALDGDKLHPAILLTGTRGVGKTTLARIIAKGLNCETGVSAHPCGVCSACTEVDAGRFIDMLEIDAASNTGVDNVRDLIDNAQYSPARGRYKVYLIDEVHMLSKGAFNALLKTLEEPPPHVKFILATTDPQKLPVTVLSRCLQFNLKRLTVAAIREQLALVLNNEGIAFEPAAIAELARAADGSMRDGLSLLDQAIAFSGGAEIRREPVEEMLGSVGRQTLLEVLAALARGDADGLLACIQRLDAQAPDYAALLNDLAAVLQRVSVLQLLPNAQNEDDEDALVALKSALAVEDVQLYYQIAVLGRRDLPYAPDPRLGFEMTLLRMLAFKPDDGAPARAAPQSAARSTNVGSVAAASAAATIAEAPATFAAPTPAQAPAARVNLPADAAWDTRVDAMTLEGLPKQLARNCAWGGRDGNVVRLSLDVRAKHLLQDERRAAIERALSTQLGEPLKLIIELAAEAALESPAQLDQQRASERQRAAEIAIEADPAVRAFKDMFGASVKPGSVRPLDS
jgi:DNA polymerase-3 subunit gamma/tau